MKKFIVLVLLLSLPTFGLMLRPGIFTMHDFHPFRLFEFNKCIQDGIFPCRWAPDAENGYGEPLFNFYGQFPYWVGELFVLSGFGILTSIKITFILTLVLSGLAMYWVASRYSNYKLGLLASLLYVYAPYRAVDVWVRGALGEAFAFILYPLIFYFLDQAITVRKSKYFILLAVFVALLIITHNLSFVMFGLALGAWTIFRMISTRSWIAIPNLFLSGILALLLSSFYLLPVAVETSLISLQSATTEGYYNYQLHYTSLKQLFWSRFWGYGASVWSDGDGMSFSAGQIQATVLGAALIASIIRRNQKGVILSLLGVLCLFMTHGKSEIIWKLLPPLTYIQFPWRFLAPAAFFSTLAAATSFHGLRIPKTILATVIILVIMTNVDFFRPDIWHVTDDVTFFSGKNMEYQMQAHKDFWPKTAGPPPQSLAPTEAEFTQGSGIVKQISKRSASMVYDINIFNGPSTVVFPVVFFPGWTSLVDGVQQPVYPDPSTGHMAIDLPAGEWTVELKFIDTWPRTLGNVISAGALLGVISFVILKYEKK